MNTVTAYMVKPRGNGYGKWMSKILEAYIPFIFISLTLTLTVMSTAPRVLADTPLRGGSVAGGNISIIVIPVAFKNLEGSVSLETIERRVFVELNDYFQQVSYGRLKVTGDVAPGWYRLSKPVEWYGEGVERWESLVYDAVRAADHDVNYRDYSFIMIVHAGDDESRSLNKTDITSFGTHGRAILQTLDGQLPFGVSCLAERDPLGPYAHYLALNLGLPYLHDNWWEVGEWDLMAHGFWAANGSLPVHPTSVAKVKVGWLSEDNVAQVGLGEKKDVKVAFLEEKPSGVAAVKIPVGEHEYFMVETRAKRGFDAALPDEGVLIYSINEKLTPGDGRVRLLDGHGETATLNDASYQPGEGYVDSANSIRIQILTKQGDGYLVMVDRSGPAPDIAVTKVYFQPTAVQENETVTILGAVANLGVKAANNFKLNLYINDQPYKTFTLSLKPGANATVQADWVAKSGLNKVRLALDRSTVQGDANPDNDQYTADLPVGYSIIVEVPYNLTVKVNGVEHKPSGDGRVEIPVLGGEVTLELEQTIPLGEGVRAAFKGWSDGDHSNPRKLYVDRTLSLKALFQKEYRVDVDPGGGAVQGAGWYPEGSEATVKAVNPTVLEENKHRLLFQGWGGGLQGSDPTLTFPVNGPVKLQANWKNQYYLTVSSPIGPVSGSGWYDEQAVARFGVEIPVVEEEDTRRTFEGWRGDFAASAPNGALTMDGPKKVEAVWKVEYKVKVESPYGQPTGSGWYQEGETAEIAVASMVDHGNGTRHVFQAWRGDVESVEPSIQLKVDRPKHLWAEWSTMYLLTLAVKGVPPSDKLNITVNGQPLTVNASKPLQMWVPAGETVTLNATKTIPAKYGYYMLDRWENATGTPVESVLTVDNPITVNAVYKPGVGCLIATATYGSELTPQVSFLRSFRDTQIMESKAGRSFMNAFNAWYYSFSPNIALWINNHEPSKPPIRGALTPLLSILTVTAYLYEVFNVNPEAAALISGLTASLLIGVVYLSPVGGAVTLTLSRGRRVKEVEEWLKAAVKVFTLSLGLSLTAVALGEFTCNGLLLSASTATLVLTSLGLGALTPLTLTALLKNRTGGLHVW